MGGNRNARVIYCPSFAEPWLVQKSVPGEIHGNESSDQSGGSGVACGYDLSDGKRDRNVPACVRVSSDCRRYGNGKTGTYGSMLLGLCPDGAASGISLEYDDGNAEKYFRSDRTIRNPQGDFSDIRYRDRGIRALCFCDKRSGDLHVSEDPVCFLGLQ